MPDRTFLSWPFFEDVHGTVAGKLEQWAGGVLQPVVDLETVLGRNAGPFAAVYADTRSALSRLKTLVGVKLAARAFENQRVEAPVKCRAPN
jgi:hypothetical protein